MGKPKSNGLIELMDEKSQDRGFFCMKLANFISEEWKENLIFDSYSDLWQQRFTEAKSGQCTYRDECPIYARTISEKSTKNINNQQLYLEL